LIRYIRHNEIDFGKWDRAIDLSCYESPYGYSWYLNLAAENWDALVEDDYRSVMPLTWKKKYLLTLLYQPLNTQQLGIFSVAPPSESLVREFLENIPPRFLLADICFNLSNDRVSGILPAEKRANYEICLEKDYQDLYQGYHSNTRRNLAKATRAGLRTGHAGVDDFLVLKAARDPMPFRQSRYERLHKLRTGLLKRNSGTISAAWEGDALVAAVFWLHSQTRTIYLLPVSDKAGREYRAMFLLVDQLIREQANTNKILDFEGSNIKSIARFFEGFGAARKDYFRVTLTGPRLHYLINRMK
jgi:hypothetical protein